jgi:hypothetical protein
MRVCYRTQKQETRGEDIDGINYYAVYIQQEITEMLPFKVIFSNVQSHINCNFASCAVWLRNLVSHFGEGTQTEGF